jgi:hypothetical protein
MFELFKKTYPEELNKVHLFERIVSPIPGVSKHSYRKNGKYKIVLDGKIRQHKQNINYTLVRSMCWLGVAFVWTIGVDLFNETFFLNVVPVLDNIIMSVLEYF